MDIYTQIAEKIISEQEKIIGPVAIQQARQVPGVFLDWSKHEVKLEGDPKTILTQLVEKYKELFGRVALEVCKDAAKSVQQQDGSKPDLPSVLR